MEYFYEHDGKEIPIEENILSALLATGNLFVFKGEPFVETENEDPGIRIAVNCNDLFYWGCADYEEIPFDELGPLMKYHLTGPWGMDKWCCKRRNLRPQAPVEKKMREAGVWDEAMEALPSSSVG